MQRRRYSEVGPTRCERDPTLSPPSLPLPVLVEVGGERIHCGPKCLSYQSEKSGVELDNKTKSVSLNLLTRTLVLEKGKGASFVGCIMWMLHFSVDPA